MFQILLHTLTNLFDSTNLIKLIWLCISGDLSIHTFFISNTLISNARLKLAKIQADPKQQPETES